jgi:hypothetical protein
MRFSINEMKSTRDLVPLLDEVNFFIADWDLALIYPLKWLKSFRHFSRVVA